jgi:hypothetical protein
MTFRHVQGDEMKPVYVLAAALAATALWAVAAESMTALPAPWMVSGQQPGSYEAGIDSAVTSSGKGAKYLRYVRGRKDSWGTLMQQISARAFRGQRVRFQAKVKAQDVDKWAGLWMRVDTGMKSVAFYNSEDKPITGTTDWQVRSVVLDVADDADVLSFGVINGGKGEVWLDELSVEAVGADVPVDVQPNVNLPERPAL